MLSLPLMKRIATYLAVCFLALLVCYGGSGVNLFTFCCDDCQSEGLSALLENRCCEIHDHHHCDPTAHHADGHCDDETDESECCGVDRIEFEWKSVSTMAFDFQPLVMDLPAFQLSYYTFVPDPYVKLCMVEEASGPPPVCPKVYLSLLTTLII